MYVILMPKNVTYIICIFGGVKIMANKNLMKSKIALMGYTQKKLTEKIGMPVPTLTQKINNLLPFRTAEIDKIQKELNLTNDEVVEIFITGGK